MTYNAQAPASSRATTFVGGKTGRLLVVSHTTISGEPIERVDAVDMIAGFVKEPPAEAIWTLRGVATNDRYTTRAEKTTLIRKQAPIGRPEAILSALVLLRKRSEWWALTQDERREILEEDLHHIAIGLRYLPAVARRLLHCRDLEDQAPFDFLAYLDYAPVDGVAFDDMMDLFRKTKEWAFMDREIDIRLARID